MSVSCLFLLPFDFQTLIACSMLQENVFHNQDFIINQNAL